jgi:hypothetical protein
MSLDLWPQGLTIENATGTLTVVGDVPSIQHRRNNLGGGGGSARIGGEAPAGDRVVGGGSNEGGEQIGNDPDFFWPTIGGGSGWTNPTNAIDRVDGTYATDSSGGMRNYVSNDQDVPVNDSIVGIEVLLEVSATTNSGSIEVELSWDNGDAYTTTGKTTGTLTTSDRVIVLGGPSDTWGRTWSPSEFTGNEFQIRLIGNPSSNTVRVDAIQVKVYHQASGGGQGGGGGGGAI